MRVRRNRARTPVVPPALAGRLWPTATPGRRNVLWLLDRRGGRHELDHRPDEPVSQALLRHGVPPTSVLVYRNDEHVVPDDARLASATVHIARLIEGYDLMGIRELYGPDLSGPESMLDIPAMPTVVSRS